MYPLPSPTCIAPLDRDNLVDAQAVLGVIFPEEKGLPQRVFAKALSTPSQQLRFFGRLGYLQYWLLYHDNTPIGSTGLYSVPEAPAKNKLRTAVGPAPCSLGLGWYGIVPDFRRRGYGEALLRWTMQAARERNCERLELWTTDEPSMQASGALYQKLGFNLFKTKPAKDHTILYLEKEL